MAAMLTPTPRTFTITVLGRLLELLGLQMYKRRDIALAELVANCWDAGASEVHIQLPERNTYDPEASRIVMTDNGCGMSPDDVDAQYLVVGRNRREGGALQVHGRAIMGRKGIGKLAGFGIASRMSIETWRDGTSSSLTLDIQNLKKSAGKADKVPLEGLVGPVPNDVASPTGTRITLQRLKHKSPVDVESVRLALGRRFSRSVRGRMKVFVNGQEVAEPQLEIDQRFPDDGYDEATLSDGNVVKYYYEFTNKPIPTAEMRGFTIYVHGKTAQAPDFFFGVEGHASGQHGTKYLTGVIEADYLDDAVDDDSDRVSTDRQHIDWESDELRPLQEWGERLTRDALLWRANRMGEVVEKTVLSNDVLRSRIERLDTESRKQVSKYLRDLGKAEPDSNRVMALADALVKAYEYRHFHDIIEQIDDVSEKPAELELLLEHLSRWKVLESRAILEIVNGRIEIIDKFYGMIVNDAPETAHRTGDDNLHDLLAQYPWLINPEWQVLAEEKRISRQLRDWNAQDVTDEDERLRYDFLALTDEKRLVIVEIKRSGHPVRLDELQRLETYRERLATGTNKELHMVMLCGTKPAISPQMLRTWEEREDGEILYWKSVHDRTKRFYQHYRAVLEGDIDNQDFARKQQEVARTRQLIATGSSFRGKEARKTGLGSQDVEYEQSQSKKPTQRTPVPPSRSSGKSKSQKRRPARRKKRH